MRCLSPEQTKEIFGGAGFGVSLEHTDYRRELVLDLPNGERQYRIAANLPPHASGLTPFLAAANRWLPTDRARLLWIGHWCSIPADDPAPLVEAARRSLGELRSLEEAPGHLFGAHPYDQAIETRISADHSNDLGLLVGLTILLVLSGSDGWLIAQGSQDRIEFWESHIFFHSTDEARMAEACDLLTTFGCKLWDDSKVWLAAAADPQV